MSKLVEARTTQTWRIAAAGLAVGVAAAGWYALADDPGPGGATREGTRTVTALGTGSAAPGADPGRGAESLAVSALGTVPTPAGNIALPLGPEARDAAQQLRQLASLPAGDAAIALGRQLEAGIGAANQAAYVDALLNLDGPAGDRTAVAALARVANSDLVETLAAAYGSLPAERRGRILQVLENAANPDAMAGLESVIVKETDERGSPLLASAMVGMAHLGTQPAVERLITQVSGPNDAQALNALQRVATRQGVELLRTASAGGKGYESLSANQRATFGRVADAAAAALPN